MKRRLPLVHQVLWPLLGIVITVHVIVFWITVQLTVTQKRREIESRLAAVVQTIEQANFPLTQRVIHQMKGLSGAEFAIRDEQGNILVSTRADLPLVPGDNLGGLGNQEMRFIETTSSDGVHYIASAVDLPVRDRGMQTLQVFYPAVEYRRQYWEAVRPVVTIGAMSAAITVVLAVGLALRWSRPIVRFRGHVEHAAIEHIEPIPIPERNDEIRDLAVAFNQMLGRLRTYEEAIRQTEQVRVLGLMRGGIAHHLRNLITGAYVALEVHRTQHRDLADEDSLRVATRQLALMERYLKQFMEVSPSQARERHPVDLNDIVRRVVELVQPSAQHAGVELEVDVAANPVVIDGNIDQLEQAVLNLALNGLDAARSVMCQSGIVKAHGMVRIRVGLSADHRAEVVVEDNGPGSSLQSAERMFDPFVTDKPDGIGLGLAVVQQVARDHGGVVTYQRDAHWTRFTLGFPTPAVSTEETTP